MNRNNMQNLNWESMMKNKGPSSCIHTHNLGYLSSVFIIKETKSKEVMGE